MTAAGPPSRGFGQESLDLDGDLKAGRRSAGRVEQLVARSIDKAGLDERDAGAAALAVSMARAVDRGAHDPYAVAAVGRELSALLARLKLDPVSRDGAGTGGVGDQAAEWLSRVTEPT
jgi:hypothetical protein